MGHFIGEIPMKKFLLSAAMIAVSGVAGAQSSVTLFGVVDVDVQHGWGSLSKFTGVGSSGSPTSSRWGLRGSEDLGGGLQAAFWLESQIQVDNGQGLATNSNNQTTGTTAAPNGTQGLTFNRRSTVSLIGSFGELRLGRDYSVQYYNRPLADPFGNNGVGASQTQIGSLAGPVSPRASNAVMYFLPEKLGGFYGEVQYYFGENASNAGATANAGNGGGVRVGYKAGRLDVAAAYARTQYAQTATTGDITSSNIAARWDFGPVVAMAGYYRDRVASTIAVQGRGWQVGGVWIVGPGEIKALLSRYGTDVAAHPETTKLSLGYLYNLSKRTALYTTLARVRNTGGATAALDSSTTAANEPSTGLEVGVRTSF
jgi:predicted porin